MQSRSPLRGIGRCHSAACRGGQCGAAIGLESAAFDRLMPLHVIASLDGTILRTGPSVAKLCGSDITGRDFSDHFDFRHPRNVITVRDLAAGSDQPLRLTLRDSMRTGLKGQAVPLACGRSVLINLSFGIAVADAVRRFSLTSADFGGTDLGTEVLFLAEAQGAALSEMRRFSQRLEQARAQAEQDASTDSLTGLCNRRAVDGFLADLVDRGAPFAMAQIDIDGFTRINDRVGHRGGDTVLRQIAQRLRDCVRDNDMLARLGGDSFLVIVGGEDAAPDPNHLAARIFERLSDEWATEAQAKRLRISIGAIGGPTHAGQGPANYLDAVDAALLDAKRAGGGQYMVGAAPKADAAPGRPTPGQACALERAGPAAPREAPGK